MKSSDELWGTGRASGCQSVASRLYGPPRICKGGAVRASRFSCTLVSGLWRGNLGSRALMESAHASPHLPNGLEWAQRELRLLACRSDLSCHQLLFSLATVGELTLARILGHRRAECGRGSAPGQGTQRCPRAVHGRGLLNRPSAGGQAVDIATSRRVLLRERFHTCRACAAPCHGPLTPAERDSPGGCGNRTENRVCGDKNG